MAYGVCVSMSGKGDPYDNAMAESFFSTLRAECVELQRFATRRQARLAVFEYVADLLRNFKKYWALAEGNPKEEERLLNLMLVRVWAEDGQITKLCLRPNFHVAAGLDTKRPTEVSVDLACYQNGRTGIGRSHVYGRWSLLHTLSLLKAWRS